MDNKFCEQKGSSVCVCVRARACVLEGRSRQQNVPGVGPQSNQLLRASQIKLCTHRQLTSFHVSLLILSELPKQGVGFLSCQGHSHQHPGPQVFQPPSPRQKCARETLPELTYLSDKLCNQENTLKGRLIGQCSPTPRQKPRCLGI